MSTKSVVVSFFCIILFLVFIKVFDISYPLKVTISNTSSELAVVGEGKVDVVPDTAYVDVGITVSNAKTVEEAQGQINTINNQLIASLTKLGISKNEIKTTNYSISPTYTYENNVNRISGYDGNATITVKTQKIEMVPSIIEEGTKAGANQINNTRFVVDTPEKYRESAREKAISNAKDQAAKMAQSLGIKLGRVVNVVESIEGGLNPVGVTIPYAAKMSGLGMGDSAPALESGSQTITSTVTLYFEKR